MYFQCLNFFYILQVFHEIGLLFFYVKVYLKKGYLPVVEPQRTEPG
jgi:hypothetical protein